MISAPQPLAVEAGAECLSTGGNAIDAAVTMAFLQGVVDPQMCGLGGGGCATVFAAASAKSEIFEFYPRAPLAARPDMFEDKIVSRAGWGGFVLDGRVNEIGYSSICTPLAPRGLKALHSAHGRLRWRDILAPAIAIATEGAPVYHHVHERWIRHAAGFVDSITRHSATSACARQYMRDGRMLEPGERMQTREYAETLSHIADHGAEDFHVGEIASRIALDMGANGGLVTLKDLAKAEPTRSAPVTGQYRGYDIEGPPPPGAGVAVIAILNMLAMADLSAMGHNSPRHLHFLASALRYGLADWKAHTGDPAFVENPIDWLISQERAVELVARMEETPSPDDGGEEVPDSRDTTHLCAMDEDGNAVSLTHTLALGSGVVTPGLGFMYNNAMMLFDPRPGHPNSVAPGRIRQHAVSACLLSLEGGPIMVVGAPGGHGIVSGVVQTISNIVDFGMTPQEAVSAPRIHCEGELIEAEARIPRSVVSALETAGKRVRHSCYSYDFQSGRPHVVIKDPATGQFSGGADPRGGGMALLSYSV